MKNKLVAISALASAALASVCCIGPLAYTGLGLGSLGLAAGLTRYRPLFLLLTATALAVGFYLAYRKRSVACADGTCEVRSGSRTMKAALWVITAAALALATFPGWSSWIMTQRPASAPAGAHALTLRITGMDCAACTSAIKKSVEKVPGVYSADVDYDHQEAIVIASPKADPKAVVKAVESAGYKATILDGGKHGKS
jgi:copper chaperone CopZ